MDDIVIKVDKSLLYDQPTRSKRLCWLGVALLVAFFMPIYKPGFSFGPIQEPSSFEFINISGLFKDGVPGILKFMLIWPLIAGLGAIISSIVNKGFPRSIIFMALGITPVIVLASASEFQSGFQVANNNFGSVATISGMISVAAWIALVAGTRSLHYVNNRAARIIAALGGVLYLASQFIPVNDVIPFIATFSAFGQDVFPGMKTSYIILCLGNVLFMLAVMTAAGFCITSFFKREIAQRLGDLAFLSIVIGVLVMIFSIALAMMFAPSQQQPDGFFMMFVTASIKTLCWVFGLFFLVPLGLADLVINLHKEQPQTIDVPDEPPQIAPQPDAKKDKVPDKDKPKPKFTF